MKTRIIEKQTLNQHAFPRKIENYTESRVQRKDESCSGYYLKTEFEDQDVLETCLFDRVHSGLQQTAITQFILSLTIFYFRVKIY